MAMVDTAMDSMVDIEDTVFMARGLLMLSLLLMLMLLLTPTLSMAMDTDMALMESMADMAMVDTAMDSMVDIEDTVFMARGLLMLSLLLMLMLLLTPTLSMAMDTDTALVGSTARGLLMLSLLLLLMPSPTTPTAVSMVAMVLVCTDSVAMALAMVDTALA